MAANEVEKKEIDGEKTVTESTWKRLMKIGEFRMLIYVIPVALVLLVVALLLGK
jgi:cell division protein FtsL